MKTSWALALMLIGVIGIVSIILFAPREKQPAAAAPAPCVIQKCPTNDIIIYTNGTKAEYMCPAVGQEMTVVRQPGYDTYIKCSCPK